ncbi:MAG TPA: LytTR family DNA-binding domain-containing protein [Gemmatimonadota bacterium]|nr:LytTR family DNA-binding domain-containing protein [Gemmatimonadota bacterium]
MEPIRTIIVDDEPLGRSRIAALLEDEDDIEIVAQCGDGAEALRVIGELQPQLLFLDIQIPGMTGFDLLRSLDRANAPIVIFVTAHDEFAIQAFDVHALDYLLKPFDDERFYEALDRARAHMHDHDASALRHRLRDFLREANGDLGHQPRDRERRQLTRIVVKDGDRILFLKVDDVDWIEAADYYAKIHVAGSTYMIRETLANLEAQLDPERFVRIHRSTIVNLDRVQEMQPWFHGAFVVLLVDGTELRLSRSRREHLQTRLQQTF